MKKLFVFFSLCLTYYISVAHAPQGNPQQSNFKNIRGNIITYQSLNERSIQSSFFSLGNKDLKQELVSKRNRFSKHFVMNNGEFRMYTSPSSIHYQTANGWQEIDNTIQTNNSGLYASYPYYNGSNAFKTYYPASLQNGQILTTLAEGSISETLEGFYAVNQSGQTVYQYAANAVNATPSENQLAYVNLFPNTTARYAQQNDGRKFDLILQNNQMLNSLPASAKYLVIKEKINIPASWSVSESENGINIYQGNTWLACLPKPVAYENPNSGKTNLRDNDMMLEGSNSFTRNGNELTVYTKFDLAWLQDPQRAYPVNLDPTVQYYPFAVSMATGRLTSAAGAKTSGALRLSAAGGGIAWAKFDISTLPAGATISAANYVGVHYSGTSTIAGLFKLAYIIGMQAVDPVTSLNSAINTQIVSTGPVYSSTYQFGGFTVPTTYTGALGGQALADIAAQQTQGWTALGFNFASSSTSTMLQYGYDAAVSTNRPYLELTYSISSCSSVTAGTAQSSVALACGDPFTLTLNGNSTGTGTTFQWQSSPPGANTWTNIGTAQASPFYTTSQSVPTDYRCIVTCTSSSLTSTSTTVAVGQNPVDNCYCVPTGASTSSRYIVSFSTTGALTNITNPNNIYTSSPVAGYADYTSLIASATPGSTVSVSIAFTTGSHAVGLWVDWNQDGDFNDAGENPVTTGAALTTSPYNSSFVVPATALSGNTRLRVRTAAVSGPVSACGLNTNGEAEDYTINVLGPCTSAIAASITPASYTICPLPTQVLTATMPVLQLGTSYQWKQSTTSGGPYTDIAGATNLSYTTIALPSGTYYYVMQTTCANCGPCSILSNEVTIVSQLVTAPTQTATTCDSYSWNSSTYTTSGIYTYTSLNNAGCVNTATLNLTVNYSTTNGNVSATACDSYSWNSSTYTTSGIYTYTSLNNAGCVNTATLNLTVNYSTADGNATATACNSYSWNSSTYATSGTYTYTSLNNAGCVNTATLNLTVNYSTTNGNGSATTCDTYTWNGSTYTTSGIYTYTSLNNAGCVNTATLNLTVNSTADSNATATACDSYSWNGSTYTTSGTYTYTSLNNAGCTHTLTLQLTVSSSTISNGTVTAYNSYIWSANAQTYTQSGTYTHTSLNAAGCTYTQTLVLVLCSLSISSQPTNINTTPGSNATFTIGVTATDCNTATSYQWQTNLGFGWQTLQNAGQYTGVNTNSLQVSNVSGSNTNQQFRCLVSTGNLSDTSQAASINIINSSNPTNSGITHAIPYQAVVRDGNGNLLSNHPLQVRCTLHDGTASGNIIYQETHSISTNNLGLFTLQIGTGTPVVSSIDSINWALYKKFIQIEVDTTSQGTSYSDLGTQQLMAVPYALYAETAGNALSAPSSLPNGTAAGQMLYWNGTAWVSVAPTTSLPGNQSKTLKYCNGVPTWEDCPAVLATVVTSSITNITGTTANSGGNIISDGGTSITASGVCWSTSSNPTVALSTKTIDGSGTGSFTSSITGLALGTTYYVRAYATSSVGTAYGNEEVFTTDTIAVGQSYQGGIIAYILQAGDPGYDANVPHGLIAAPSNQSTGIVWWNGSYVITSATATALGTGNANTNTIVAVQGAGNYAAKLCYDLVLNGYSDWYLPSRDELNKLYLNQTAIGGFATATYYWSSSEYSNDGAWYQYFSTGNQADTGKGSTFYVRAVRAF